jgi:hypothetical protein
MKFFTPQEANKRLPFIKKIVQEILTRGQSTGIIDPRMEALMAELEAEGCYFKDWNFEIGLVDFPAIMHAQEVMLCWRSDEPQVSWFHGFDDGYAGRRPITPSLIFS